MAAQHPEVCLRGCKLCYARRRRPGAPYAGIQMLRRLRDTRRLIRNLATEEKDLPPHCIAITAPECICKLRMPPAPHAVTS